MRLKQSNTAKIEANSSGTPKSLNSFNTDPKLVDQSNLLQSILDQSQLKCQSENAQNILYDLKLLSKNDHILKQQLQDYGSQEHEDHRLKKQHQNSEIATLKIGIQSLIMKIKTMKLKGFDQIEEGRKIIAFNTESLNESMKSLIELQKNLEEDCHLTGNEQITDLIKQQIRKEKADAESLERDHQQKLLRTMLEIQKISNYKQSISNFDHQQIL